MAETTYKLRALSALGSPVGLLLVVLASCTPTSAPDTSREAFQQSRREAELKVRLDNAELKLDAERQRCAVAATQADRWREECQTERIGRQIEKEQRDLALGLNEELKKKLERMNAQDSELQMLRDSLLRLNKTVQERDAELARLREQLDKLQGAH